MAIPGLFFAYFCPFQTILQNCRLGKKDLNSDRRSIKWARWPRPKWASMPERPIKKSMDPDKIEKNNLDYFSGDFDHFGFVEEKSFFFAKKCNYFDTSVQFPAIFTLKVKNHK